MENAVLVGTLGRSPVIDHLVKDGRLDVKDVQGQWESFVIATVVDPLAGVARGLVIAGSDLGGSMVTGVNVRALTALRQVLGLPGEAQVLDRVTQMFPPRRWPGGWSMS